MKNGDLVADKGSPEEIDYRIEEIDENGTCKLRMIGKGGNGFAMGRYSKTEIKRWGIIISQFTSWRERYQGRK